MQSKKLPLSFHSFLQMHKLVVTFAHQLVAYWLVIGVLLLFVLPHWQLLFAIPLLVVFGLFLSVPVGMVSTRYRDVGQMIGFVMQALFLLTPIFWRRAQMPEHLRWIVDYNPFAHLLEVVRQPLLGFPAPAYEWAIALMLTAVAALGAWVSLALHRKRVVFWL
jgi:ABC-type polysaccharide/polyol phosphate export permease